jgi:hypothetical protein
VSRSTGTIATGRATRFAVRSLAVVLLLLGTVGSSTLAGQRDQSQAQTDPSAAEALTYPAEDFAVEQEALRRVVEANERTDRSRREAVEEAEALAEQQTSRADAPDVQPEPEPEPEPEQPASSGGGEPSEPAGPIPDSCNEYSGNRATGCALLLDAGFSLDQMSCLDSLWNKESGWNERAQNPSSGAYGIPQSLPGDKMASHGSDWQTNPATQIAWGLDYIKGRYGTPCSAWSHSQANGWY